MRKIAICAFQHESNTFVPHLTERHDFDVVRGKGIYNNLSHFPTIRGMINELSKNRGTYEIIPTVFARALPFGKVERGFYELIKAEIIERIKGVKQLGAVLLALHGSMVVDGIGDGEGDLLQSIRMTLGKKVPLICALDMHATLTPTMVRNCDAITGFRTAPHTDQERTGARAAQLAQWVLTGINRKTWMAVQRIPMLIPGEVSETSVKPMQSLINYINYIEKQEDMLDMSVFLGFPWADVPSNGAYAVAVSSNPDTAKEEAQRLALEVWSKRTEFAFQSEARSPVDAIERAIHSDDLPVVISDTGDNPTAGAPGDNTNMLRLLLSKQATDPGIGSLLVAIPDPEAINFCFDRGVDRTVTIRLGGKMDSHFSEPLEVECKILKLLPRYNNRYDVVLLRVDKIRIIVTSRRVAVTDVDLLNYLGLDVEKTKVIVVKSGYLIGDYKAKAGRSILALTTGYTDQKLSRFTFAHVKRPIYPLDSDVVPPFLGDDCWTNDRGE